MLKQDEHGGLRDLGHRSVKPNVHGERVILLCVRTLFKAELNLHKVEVVRNQCLPGPFIGQCQTVTLCPRA
jgi:hypothetical protein